MAQRECPECVARRDRFAGAPEDLAKFKVGQMVRGCCDRCIYQEPDQLDDTAEFNMSDPAQQVA